ncbi:MAG: SDR family oxidoreductase [Oscillospiraceae bacterium]
MNRMQGKIALVTACTKGIGLATVEAFVAEGATVYMAVRNLELGAEVAATINAKGPGSAKPVYCDAYQFDSYAPMVDEVLKDAGRIDVLVNNFGGTKPSQDLDIIHGNWENFQKGIDVNIGSVFMTSHLVIEKAMVPQKSGVIVNIGSVAGLTYDYKQCAYGVAKAGILHLSRMIAVQCGRYGIRCNAVCPGMTATAAVANNLPIEYQNKQLKATPMKRMATPQEIANAVLYFCDDGAAFTTGQILAVEGGYSFAPGTYGDDIGGAALAEG